LNTTRTRKSDTAVTETAVTKTSRTRAKTQSQAAASATAAPRSAKVATRTPRTTAVTQADLAQAATAQKTVKLPPVVAAGKARKASVVKATTGKAATGKAATGKAATGKAATGKAATGKAATGKAATGKAAAGKAAAGKAAAGKAATGKAAAGKAAAGKAAAGKEAVGAAKIAPGAPKRGVKSKAKVTEPTIDVRVRDAVIARLDSMKANDLLVIDVRGKTSLTDCLVIASGTSTRHVKSMSDEVVVVAKNLGMSPLGVEGEREAEWVLVDLGDTIFHVMLPRTREFYGLERLWTVGDDPHTVRAG
jgi:ribosome silencing factor RsfS/YbeB/iojap